MPEPSPRTADRPSMVRHLQALPTRLRRPVSGGAYCPEIDGLRFFAIAIVVIGHLAERFVRFFPVARDLGEGTTLGGWLQRPGIGVYLFFAISGFVLASGALRAKSHPLSAPSLRRYFGRRALRIEPPYLLLLVGTFLVLAATGFRPEGTHQFEAAPQSLLVSLAGSLAYSHDLLWGSYPRLFPPGWSLEVEIQFYVLAPLVFALWLACRPTAAKAILAIVGLLGGSLLSLLAPDRIGPLHTDMSIARFAHFFWLGVVLAQAQPWLALRMACVSPALATVLGWGGLAVYLVLPNAPEALTPESLLAGVGLRVAALAAVAAMFLATFAPASGFRAFCVRPWVSLLGGACYSLYLTHLQVMQASTGLAARLFPDMGLAGLGALAVVELLVVGLVGLLFYGFVERVFMRPDWPAAAIRWLAAPRFARAVR